MRPSGQSLSVAIGAAIAAKAGLAFVQSYVDSRHFPTLSAIDCKTHSDIDKQGMKVLPPNSGWVNR